MEAEARVEINTKLRPLELENLTGTGLSGDLHHLSSVPRSLPAERGGQESDTGEVTRPGRVHEDGVPTAVLASVLVPNCQNRHNTKFYSVFKKCSITKYIQFLKKFEYRILNSSNSLNNS